MHFMKKKYIITFGIALIICGTIFGWKLLLKENTIIGTKDIFNNINTSTKGDFIVESLELKEQEETENEENSEIGNENVFSNKLENIVINKPIVKFEEEKTEIIEDKSTSNNNVETIEDNIEDDTIPKNTFVKLKKNEKAIAKMQAMIFALVPTEWFFSNSKVVIDSNGIDENTEYLDCDKINKDVFKNKVSGDIKIYAYDEIWNNGTEYVLRTRYYIR